MLRRTLYFAGAAVAAFLPQMVQAQQTAGPIIQGTVTGTFSNGLTSMDGYSYLGSTFNVTTINAGETVYHDLDTSFADLPGAATTPNYNNFGSVAVASPQSSNPSVQLTLDVHVQSLVGTFQDQYSQAHSVNYTTPFDVLITGTLSNSGFVSSSPTSPLGNFTDSSGAAGSLFFGTAASFSKGQNLTPIVGGVTINDSAPTPEPAPVLGCGLACSMLLFKKKRALRNTARGN